MCPKKYQNDRHVPNKKQNGNQSHLAMMTRRTTNAIYGTTRGGNRFKRGIQQIIQKGHELAQRNLN